MRVFITGSSNNPSGGTKVMNQVSCLFVRHGIESYVVTADDSGPATFLDDVALYLTLDQYRSMLRSDDITIDFWPAQVFYDIAKEGVAETRVFWQHGASIPTWEDFSGSAVFESGNPYTHHWNVSKACQAYIETTYGQKSDIVHPFFETQTLHAVQKTISKDRSGMLLLGRRGRKYIDSIRKGFGQKIDITVLEQPFHERELFEQLRRHKYYVSIDDGIWGPTLLGKLKHAIKRLISASERRKDQKRNSWIIPKGHLLGFPMPPAEAAALGCTVIGFAMGGGKEWMTPDTCFLADDADLHSLLNQISKALAASDATLMEKAQHASERVSQFNQAHTWKQMQEELPVLASTN